MRLFKGRKAGDPVSAADVQNFHQNGTVTIVEQSDIAAAKPIESNNNNEVLILSDNRRTLTQSSSSSSSSSSRNGESNIYVLCFIESRN
jgi:hypothetical protein